MVPTNPSEFEPIKVTTANTEFKTVSAAIPTGTIAAIPAKAHAHRALIAAALADSPSTLLIAHYSEDIDATIASLRGLGAIIEKTESGVRVIPIPENQSHGTIDAHESGTTLRLLLSVGSAICDTTDVTAAGRLPNRPLEPLKSQLEAHGITFSATKPPFTISGHLTGGLFEMVGNVSSQFFSGLLLASPKLDEDTLINSTTPLQSRDYVTLTRHVMADFGVMAYTTDDGNSFTVPKGQHYHGLENYPIEGDWSNSAIWLVAAAITGQPLTITNLQPDSTQADKRILDIIDCAGTTVEWQTEDGTVIEDEQLDNIKTPLRLHCEGRAIDPITVDLEQCPDLLPVLAALACSIEGESWFINGERLRLKESDRLLAVRDLVRTLGGTAHIEGDNLYINGTGRLTGGTVTSHNDHRLVMAASLMALFSDDPITITDSQAINKSYPLFFKHWNELGGHAE
ncbi:3-phosphoshikimate 1-carboxyvinyltransferase [Veillonella seminalis]|uniref:3-phosphoshikimate 1-carboxyvinyltransferase n=2 Tax=Veillonella seminalis TaxID=1502943 RepID=K9D237_9FIRM|nr:3-phosphoshikimate 1-carboxyvinyltransferase [Veillonella seminalis]EKU78624.1 3-phosphoshikimate 1-carboxyvinyltransferase [Veillonella seminalis ACS-216-V-Col6b]